MTERWRAYWVGVMDGLASGALTAAVATERYYLLGVWAMLFFGGLLVWPKTKPPSTPDDS